MQPLIMGTVLIMFRFNEGNKNAFFSKETAGERLDNSIFLLDFKTTSYVSCVTRLAVLGLDSFAKEWDQDQQLCPS